MKKMIKSVLLCTISALIITSCGNSTAGSGQKTREQGAPSAAQTGQSVQPATNQSIGSQSELSSSESTEMAAQTGDSVKLSVIASGGTILLTKATFLKNVWNYEKSPQQWIFLGDKPAIIDFYADWCGPCKIASPILEEVSHEFAGQITIYKIDTQREQELATVFGIRGIPAFLYIPKNGKPMMAAGIARTREETKQMFVDNINKILLTGN